MELRPDQRLGPARAVVPSMEEDLICESSHGDDMAADERHVQDSHFGREGGEPVGLR